MRNYSLAICCYVLLVLTLVSNVLAQERPGVRIQGVAAEIADNISGHLALHDKSCQLSPERRARLIESSDRKIRNALRAFGYYQATWEKQLVVDGNCWRLNIQVIPGAPMLLGQVQVEIAGEAQQDSAFSELLKHSPVQPGQQLNHEAYEQLKRSLGNIALRRGYPQGEFQQQQLLVSLEQNSASVRLVYDSGPRYRFGDIRFDQNDFDTDFLRRFVPFTENAPFDATVLGKFQQVLINSRYFSQVSVTQLPHDQESHEIPLLVTLTPAKKYATVLGTGIATDTGPRASISFNNTRSNSRGHRYSANLELSSLKSMFDFQYRIPLQKPDQEQMKYQFGWENEETDTAENETWLLGVSSTTAITDNWLQSIDLIYQVEAFDIAGDRATTQLLIPGIGWNRSHADNLIYPKYGWRVQTSLRGAAEQLASDLSFMQLQGSAKLIKAIGPGRFIGRLEAGSTLVDQFAEFPASLRFFAGGDNSVRGYDYEELGPLNAEGEVIGGKHLMTASLEYDFPVRTNYDLALFYDTGNAFNNSEFDVKHSLGFGARWRSPIGPIRLDFAFPLGDKQTFRLHLSMGPDL